MDIVKNNLVSIILGVISLIAISSLFWFINPYVKSMEEQAQQSVRTATSINSLLTKARVMPAPTPQGQPQPLTHFPNEGTIEVGETLRTQVQQSAQEMLAHAIELNRQPILVEGALPDPPSNTYAFDFRRLYNEVVKPRQITRDILHGGLPPTPEEIKDAEDRLWTDVYERQIHATGRGETTEPAVRAAYQQAVVHVRSDMIHERARQLKIYVEPDALTWHQAFEGSGRAPTAEEMWFAQLGIWIQANVAQAIADANADASDVTNSVVKHLIKIEFPENPYVLPGRAAPSTDTPDSYYDYYEETPPTPVATSALDPTKPLPKAYDRSITGRISNDMYDVVHFRVSLIADANRYPVLLQEFGRNRFIYIRGMRIESVDAAAQQLAGYVYGKTPVFKLDLDMEMLFFRAWTVDLMPDPVREKLGIPTRRSQMGGATSFGRGY